MTTNIEQFNKLLSNDKIDIDELLFLCMNMMEEVEGSIISLNNNIEFNNSSNDLLKKISWFKIIIVKVGDNDVMDSILDSLHDVWSGFKMNCEFHEFINISVTDYRKLVKSPHSFYNDVRGV